MIELILSGGQTGADRGGLDAAIAVGIPHGGWCPKGRKASDGRIPDTYVLQETLSDDYTVRTTKNVADSDATLVFCALPPSPGSRLTLRLAEEARKPFLHVVLEDNCPEDLMVRSIVSWFEENSETLLILNVAGSRDQPGSTRKQDAVRDIMTKVLRTLCAP